MRTIGHVLPFIWTSCTIQMSLFLFFVVVVNIGWDILAQRFSVALLGLLVLAILPSFYHAGIDNGNNVTLVTHVLLLRYIIVVCLSGQIGASSKTRWTCIWDFIGQQTQFTFASSLCEMDDLLWPFFLTQENGNLKDCVPLLFMFFSFAFFQSILHFLSAI